MGEQTGLNLYTVEKNPPGHPGAYVARNHRTLGYGLEAVLVSLPPRTATTLEGARRAVPPGLVRELPAPTDDPWVLEYWV